ncbi:TIGR02391 family protein [Pseudomonas japonica]|uniref:TIGR02391 family protein n=1 Tax=Pseudomonas japonica TaxID=256466 RepID=UPI0038206C27
MQVGNHLIMFINRAMNPVSYARDRDTFIWRKDELNVVLAFSGYYIREDGKVGSTDKAATLDAARARVGRLKAALESRNVHESVMTYCKAELLNENYFHAVLEATKGVADRIRELSSLAGDGADLVTKAFLGPNPKLTLGPLITESAKSEQRGFANLLIGLFCAVRNPLAHTPKINWPMSEQDALDIFSLVSLVQRKLDNVSKTAEGL